MSAAARVVVEGAVVVLGSAAPVVVAYWEEKFGVSRGA